MLECMAFRDANIAFKQETVYTCGAAALRTVLARRGVTMSEKEVAKLLQYNKVSGTSPKKFEQALQKLRLNYIANDRSNWSELMRTAKTHQVIIGYYLRAAKIGHFGVVESVSNSSITLFDPWSGEVKRYKRSYFDILWCRGFRYDPERRWFLAIGK